MKNPEIIRLITDVLACDPTSLPMLISALLAEGDRTAADEVRRLFSRWYAASVLPDSKPGDVGKAWYALGEYLIHDMCHYCAPDDQMVRRIKAWYVK